VRRDPVTSELREAVFARDTRALYPYGIEFGSGPLCVAPMLSFECGPCDGPATLDHVKDQPRMGKRAPSDAAHLVTLCWHHHLDGWATSHRPELRVYLRAVAGVVG